MRTFSGPTPDSFHLQISENVLGGREIGGGGFKEILTIAKPCDPGKHWSLSIPESLMRTYGGGERAEEHRS